MKKWKRLVALLICCVLLAGSPVTAYAKAYDTQIHQMGLGAAIGTAAAAVSSETAIAWILGALGITGSVAIYKNRDDLVCWCQNRTVELKEWLQKQGENVKVGMEEFEDWFAQIAAGTLDKTSECWEVFKDWAVDLVKAVEIPSTVEGGSVWENGVISTYYVRPAEEEDHSAYPYIAGESSGLSSLNNFCLYYFRTDKRFGPGLLDYGLGSASYYAKGEVERIAGYVDDTRKKSGLLILYTSGEYVTEPSNYAGFYNTLYLTISNFPFFKSIEAASTYVDTGEISWPDVSLLTLPEPFTFDSDLNLVTSQDWPAIPVDNPITEEQENEIIVAGPTSDVIERDDSLDNVDVVTNTGEKVDVVPFPVTEVELGDLANPYIGTGVIPIDTTVDIVLGTDLPIEDVVEDVIKKPDSGDYTIPNLQTLFPFCVPFDLVALFKTLSAEAEAPKFKFPLPIPTKNGIDYYYIEIDLSKFDSAAEILRAMELLAFCVGLTLITRQLIRG